ncbi:MAG: ArnT family glycosyltransferase [Bryobacteraceae bacterium]
MTGTITQTIALKVRSGSSLFHRDGLLCALLMAACLLLTHPFVEMGLMDDWSFIKTTQVFAQTGHFVYNGWAAMPLGWQILWGTLFSKLFGFSMVHVRLSTIPVAAMSVYIFHQILVRFGISRGNAAFGTLTLALSPIFMALSATYMTDIPGLFCTLLCLYLCQRAVSATADRSALVWLCLATVTNIVGGTVRQTTWLGVLLIVPSTAWLLRKRRSVFWGGTALWLVGVASVFGCMYWFNHQPYFIPENIIRESLTLPVLKHVIRGEITQGLQAFLCLLLLLFPILAACFSLVRSLPKAPLLMLFSISSVLLMCFLIYCARHDKLDMWIAPWLPHVIGQMGIAAAGGEIPGPKPGPLHVWQRIIITVLLLGSALILILHVFSRLDLRARGSQRHTLLWYQLLWLLVPYTVGYIGALSLQGAFNTIFDRYLLSLQAVGIIFLLRYYQDFAVPNGKPQHSTFAIDSLPLVSHLALLAFAYYAVAGTHDWLAFCRSSLQAAEEVRRSGVPPAAIEAGFEYTGWTQLEVGGYVNESRIRIPKGAFRPVPVSTNPPAGCAPWWSPLGLFPAVAPRYFVVFAPLPCFAPSPFSAITYRAWMPPFTRRVYIQQLKD